MVRTRIATLILLGGLALTTSGCKHGWGNGHSWHGASSMDCTCAESPAGLYDGAAPVGASGPILVSPGTQPGAPYGPAPTIVTPPTTYPNPQGPPPRIVPIPAQPMPWTGQQ